MLAVTQWGQRLLDVTDFVTWNRTVGVDLEVGVVAAYQVPILTSMNCASGNWGPSEFRLRLLIPHVWKQEAFAQ